MQPEKFQLVLVEDNSNHAELVRMGLIDCGLDCDLTHLADGMLAIDFFEKNEPYQDRITPDLVILDLRMPRADGHTVLKRLRAQADLANTPVVVMSTSESSVDRGKAAENDASRYIIKPIGIEAFLEMLQQLEVFWPAHQRKRLAERTGGLV